MKAEKPPIIPKNSNYTKLKKVGLHVHISQDLQDRLDKFMNDKEFTTPQQVIRVGINDFLKRHGY